MTTFINSAKSSLFWNDINNYMYINRYKHIQCLYLISLKRKHQTWILWKLFSYLFDTIYWKIFYDNIYFNCWKKLIFGVCGIFLDFVWNPYIPRSSLISIEKGNFPSSGNPDYITSQSPNLKHPVLYLLWYTDTVWQSKLI